MLMREKTIRVCEKNSIHNRNTITGICLNSSCSSARLVCYICVMESHANHSIIFFGSSPKDEELALKKTSVALEEYINSYVNSHFQEIPQKFRREMLASPESLEEQKRYVKKHIQDVIETSFRISTHHIKQVLSKNFRIEHQQIQIYSKILNLIHHSPRNIMHLLRNICDDNLINLHQPVRDAITKTRQALRNFQKSLDIYKSPKHLLPQQPAKQLQKAPGNNLNQQQIVGQILQKRVQQNMNLLQATYSRQEPVIKKEAMQIQNQNIIKEQAWNQLINQYFKDRYIASFNGQYIQSEQYVSNSEYSSDQYDYEEEKPKKIEFKPKKEEEKRSRNTIKRFWKKKNKELDIPSNVHSITIKCNSTQELNSILVAFDHNMVRHLQIICDISISILSQTSVELISEMTQLVSLKIYLAYGLSQPMAIVMLQKLSKLQELVLAEFADLGPQLVKSLKEHNKKLQRICFTYDMQYMINHEEILQFLPDLRQGIRQEQLWRDLTRSQLKLTNLEIQNTNHFQYWIDYIKKNKNHLKEVTINNSNDLQIKANCTNLFLALKKCTNLQYLRFEQLKFNPESLREILINNTKIKAIHISECPSVKQTYSTTILSLPLLKYFYIGLDGQFCCGENTKFASSQIQTIIIRGCQGEKGNILTQNIKNLPKLRNLSINYSNQCLNKESAIEIANSSIRYLNISSNQNASQYFDKFDKMPNIECFVSHECGLSYEKIAQLSFASKLKKLSIQGQRNQMTNEYETLNIEILVNSFPNLTHLKILNYEKIEGDLSLLSKMKFLVCIICGKLTSKGDVDRLKKYLQMNNIKFRRFSY